MDFSGLLDIIDQLLLKYISNPISFQPTAKNKIKQRLSSKQSRLYEKNGSAHICIIHTNKECVSVGTNDLHKHAEVDAIRHLIQQGFRSTKKLHLFVFRFSKTGIINSSRPCCRCSQFINKHLNLFRLICFTEKDGDVVTVLASDFDPQDYIHVSRKYRKQTNMETS